MTIYKLYSVLWQADPIVDAFLLVVLFVRRRAASFPFFTISVATDAALYTGLFYGSYGGHRLFYKLLWPLNFAQDAIGLLVVYEIATHVFRPTGVWAADVRNPLIGIASGSILVACLFAWLAHPAIGPHTTLMWRISLFYSILLNELLVGVLVLSSIVGLPWKTHAARIAQVMCAANLVGLVVQIITNSLARLRLNYIYIPLMCGQMILGYVGTVYWMVVLWRDEPAPLHLPEPLRNQLHTLQQQTENDLTKIRSWKNS